MITATPEQKYRDLQQAVDAMFDAQKAYYTALSTIRDYAQVQPYKEARDATAAAARSLVPRLSNGSYTHSCGCPAYRFDTDKLQALDGLDPCNVHSNRRVYDDLLKREVVVHRYRLIGTQLVCYSVLVADTTPHSGYAWGAFNGGRYSTHSSIWADNDCKVSAGYWDMKSFFPDRLNALPSGMRRSTLVSRYYRLRLAHINRLIRQGWPDDFRAGSGVHTLLDTF